MEHTIIYKPHCSECGKLLHGTVTYDTSTLSLYDIITPHRCPYCGTYFESILMPTPKSVDSFEIDMDDF